MTEQPKESPLVRALESNQAHPEAGHYFAHARPELVAQIEHGAQSVLDLGCGRGAFAQALKREKQVKQIWGVEVVAEMAALSQQSGAFEKVISGDLEQCTHQLPDGHFDYVVAGDVIEHLVDPWGTVAELRRKLRPGGLFICSIPNIRTFSFLMKLIFTGRFAYKESGVMDITHLRFFARKDLQIMFRDAGFDQISIAPARPKKGLGKALSRFLFRDWITKVLLVRAINPDP